MIKSQANWHRGARIMQAHESDGYRPGETLAPDYDRYRRGPAKAPEAKRMSGDVKALIFGALTALVFIAIVIW